MSEFNVVEKRLSGRIAIIDCVRTICILYIVGVWHFSNYITGITPLIQNNFFAQFTFTTLACFTLLSGLLTNSEVMKGKEKITNYLIKRFLRLYPPYFIACIGFRLTGWYSVKQMLLAMSFIGIFTDDVPVTLWYLNMMAIFIAVTPMILRFAEWKSRLISSAAIGGGIAVLCLLGLDERCLYYFPFYILPLVFKEHLKNWLKRLIQWPIWKEGLMFTGSVVFTVLLRLVCPFPTELSIVSLLYSCVMIVGILAIGSIMAKSSILGKLCTYIAFASMNMYLYHRIYYGVITRFVVNPIPWTLGYALILPSLVVICNFLQKGYDGLLRKCFHKN